MKAIKLQRGNKFHHHWLSQHIKAIVLHQREFEFEFWPIRKFHFIQPGPVPSAILNYCPIRWLLFHSPSWILVQLQVAILNYCPIRRLLSIHHLAFLTNQRWAAPPPAPPSWHRTLTFTLLTSEYRGCYCHMNAFNHIYVLMFLQWLLCNRSRSK